ncbi:hypothetical protein ACFVIM_31685 [Streptomyces sp. NPDC057638]|uniref:hypothetical protein n=1 Tax=Streptomyces sp. NPDC057638 TaxID=3346190 RepID=UPI0036BE69C7
MTTVEIAPGLVLDDEQFGAAEAGVAARAPGLGALTWERFTTPRDWTLVPDECGRGYKAEFVLFSTRAATAKVNVWFAPDLRRGREPFPHPHSHPWAFDAHVLLGGYDEDRYTPDGGAIRAERGVEHRAGGLNRVPLEVYHEVTAVHEPGRTLTLMVCGPGERGRWGYLDLATGQHRGAAPDPGFTERLKALNPQHR